MFTGTQSDFALALLDPERPAPASLIAHTGPIVTRRFAVYRNNVVAGLVNALVRRFPAAARVVGEEFFREMAKAFVLAHPPRSPILTMYGDELPDFIAGFPPAAELPYLADVVGLEAARTRAYHAADAVPVFPASMRSLPTQRLGELRVRAHPAAEIVRSQHPIVTIWAMNVGEVPLGPIADWSPQDALITRPAMEVQVRSLPEGGADFLSALFAGATLGDAAEQAAERNPQFDLAANIAGMLGAGAIASIELPETERDRS